MARRVVKEIVSPYTCVEDCDASKCYALDGLTGKWFLVRVKGVYWWKKASYPLSMCEKSKGPTLSRHLIMHDCQVYQFDTAAEMYKWLSE